MLSMWLAGRTLSPQGRTVGPFALPRALFGFPPCHSLRVTSADGTNREPNTRPAGSSALASASSRSASFITVIERGRIDQSYVWSNSKRSGAPNLGEELRVCAGLARAINLQRRSRQLEIPPQQYDHQQKAWLVPPDITALNECEESAQRQPASAF